MAIALRFMLCTLKFQPTPFRFLLYLEWVLLGSCGTLAIVEAFEKQHVPVQHFLILLTLWVMGLGLPMGSRLVKIIYTGLEIGLIFYGAMMGYLHILPMLYLIVAIRSCFLFAPLGRWAVAGFTLLLYLLHQVRYVHNITQLVPPEYQQRFWMHLIGETLMFGLGLFLVLKLANALLSERRFKEQLATTHRQLQHYAQQAEELATLQERTRIARNIHDSLGQVLVVLHTQIQAAAALWKRDPERAEPFLEKAEREAVTAMQEVRRSVAALREETLAEQPLTEAIAELVDTFREGTGIHTKLKMTVDVPLSAPISHALYRIVQEALTNIYKHAQASVVELQLEARSNTVQVQVSDDGCGFHRNGSTGSGFGLQGIRERVAALGGHFEMATEPGQGCRVSIEVPLSATTLS